MKKANSSLVLVFVPQVTSRVEFTLGFIFNTILGAEIQFTTDETEFTRFSGPKINYSQADLSSGLFLKSNTLLYEKNIAEQKVDAAEFKQHTFFFPTSENSFLPFDPFACSFYLLTRYEEYLHEVTDEHKRFADAENLLVRHQVHQKPVVDQMAFLLAEKISEAYPEFKIRKREFKLLTTIDIDNAWAFKNKKLHIAAGAFLKSLVHGQFKDLSERLTVLLGIQSDPYDTYKYILKVYQGSPDHLIFFFLLGNRSKYDKNISHKNKKFRQLISNLSSVCQIGIHPSYASNNKPWMFETEKERLEKILAKKVTMSRQHYLKLRVPQTYQNLIKSGISSDFTMGFASESGFRAGTCTPFPFFDLTQNIQTELMIHPFQIMDVTLKNQLHFNSEEAWEAVSGLMEEVKQVNGTFISLWHNESLRNSGQWAGWKNVFEQLASMGLNFEHEQS